MTEWPEKRSTDKSKLLPWIAESNGGYNRAVDDCRAAHEALLAEYIHKDDLPGEEEIGFIIFR